MANLFVGVVCTAGFLAAAAGFFCGTVFLPFFFGGYMFKSSKYMFGLSLSHTCPSVHAHKM